MEHKSQAPSQVLLPGRFRENSLLLHTILLAISNLVLLTKLWITHTPMEELTIFLSEQYPLDAAKLPIVTDHSLRMIAPVKGFSLSEITTYYFGRSRSRSLL
nr:MAG: hypothetical protein H3RhizoLitter14483_000002 [Mitovirus sp.]